MDPKFTSKWQRMKKRLQLKAKLDIFGKYDKKIKDF